MTIDTTKLDPDLYDALNERGHSDREISQMSVEDAFDEWLGWELGDVSWGAAIRRIQKNLKEASSNES